MARVRPRSNIYALLPILACLIMGAGIYFTIVDLGVYRNATPPEPTYKPTKRVPDLVKPEEPKSLEPVPDEPTIPGGEAPVAPAEGEGAAPTTGVAPAEGLAPAEGGVAPAVPPEEPEEKEEER
jgi:hypothetical protein